jgi:protein subunit release factor A
MNMDDSDLDISICKGDYSHLGSVETGVKITHKATGITVLSLNKKSQYANKVIAMELLEIALAKQR